MTHQHQQQCEEEAQYLLSEILEKVKPHLTEDEMSLLRWATGVTERKENGDQDK